MVIGGDGQWSFADGKLYRFRLAGFVVGGGCHGSLHPMGASLSGHGFGISAVLCVGVGVGHSATAGIACNSGCFGFISVGPTLDGYLWGELQLRAELDIDGDVRRFVFRQSEGEFIGLRVKQWDRHTFARCTAARLPHAAVDTLLGGEVTFDTAVVLAIVNIHSDGQRACCFATTGECEAFLTFG